LCKSASINGGIKILDLCKLAATSDDATNGGLDTLRSEIMTRLIEPGFMDDTTAPREFRINPMAIESMQETRGRKLSRRRLPIDVLLEGLTPGATYLRSEVRLRYRDIVGDSITPGQASKELQYLISTGYVSTGVSAEGKPTITVIDNERRREAGSHLHINSLCRDIIDDLHASHGYDPISIADLHRSIALNAARLGDFKPNQVYQLTSILKENGVIIFEGNRNPNDYSHEYAISDQGRAALAQITAALADPYLYSGLTGNAIAQVKNNRRKPIQYMPAVYKDCIEDRHVAASLKINKRS
jgi:DNA-binding PadR family transcriptional regulator